MFGIFLTKGSFQQWILHILHRNNIIFRCFLIGIEEQKTLVIQIVYPFEILTHIDGPAQRPQLDIEFFLDLFQQIKWLFSVPVHLVDEHDHGGVTHATNFHKLTRLLLYSLHTIHYKNYRVYRRQRPIGVFRKILVTGRIQQIDEHIPIGETHHGGGHTDTPLALDLHKV